MTRNGSLKELEDNNDIREGNNTMTTFAEMKFHSEVQLGKKPGSVSKASPIVKGSHYRSGLKPITRQQMIIEKLKLDYLTDECYNATYKTVAHFTFSDGSV